MNVLDATVMGLTGEMLWFVISAILTVLIVGGGMVIAVRAYNIRRPRS